jgi:hypothetical protein
MGVTQKTAWFMLHRVRLAMQDENNRKRSGKVVAYWGLDEKYVHEIINHAEQVRRWQHPHQRP